MKAIPPDQFRSWSEHLRRSDRTAYTDVFRATNDALYRYVWLILRDDEAAYDVLQDVFLKLWNVRHRIDPERSLKALLYQMARNTAFNHRRYRQRHQAESIDALPLEPQTAATQVDERLDHSALTTNLQRWIAELPARRREAFLLSRHEGLAHSEIARIMNLAPKTVNNHIVAALDYLRTRLKAYQQDCASS